MIDYLRHALWSAARDAYGIYGAVTALVAVLAFAFGLSVGPDVAVVAALAVAIGYVFVHMLAIGPSRLFAQLDQSPRIVVARAYVDSRPITYGPIAPQSPGMPPVNQGGTVSTSSNSAPNVFTSSSVTMGEADFAYIDWRNASTEIDAPTVAVDLSVWTEDRRQCLIEPIVGRWTEPEAANLESVPLAINGLVQTLDVAHKRRVEPSAWLYNTESRIYPAWQMTGRRLAPGTYAIKAHVRALRTDQDHWFTLVNPGAESNLRFEAADPL